MDDGFLLALAITMVVETGVLVVGLRFVATEPRPSVPRTLVAGSLASSWSLPYFWFLLPRFISGPAYVPVGEGVVVLGETIVLRYVLDLPFRQCLILSIASNLASLLAGSILARAA